MKHRPDYKTNILQSFTVSKEKKNKIYKKQDIRIRGKGGVCWIRGCLCVFPSLIVLFMRHQILKENKE